MLDKKSIVKYIKSEDEIISNAMYAYVCKLHLYDYKSICNALIIFLKKNYNKINYSYLINSKLNKEIIECLINIYLNIEDDSYKQAISTVLVYHYNIIKDMDYNFDEIIKNKEVNGREVVYNELLYKKLKYFYTKDIEDLFRLFMKNVTKFYFNKEEYTIKEKIIFKAQEMALAQREEGKQIILKYVAQLLNNNHSYIENYNGLQINHMLYLNSLLCSTKEYMYEKLLLENYLRNADLIDEREKCNYYFSEICDKDFINLYLGELNKVPPKKIKPYFFDICGYLNSDEIDQYLLKRLSKEKVKDNIIEIIRILSLRFNKEVIPYIKANIDILDMENDMFIVRDIEPLLIINNCTNILPKKTIDYQNKDLELIKNTSDVIEDKSKNNSNEKIDKDMWLKLYKMAEEIQKLEPWKILWDSDILCVRLNDQNVYCSVMGKAGYHKSIAIIKEEHINKFVDIIDKNYPQCMILNYEECITCNYLSKDKTIDGNIDIIKDLGLKFKNEWISFENFEKGYVPCTINNEQVAFLIEVLPHFIEEFKLLNSNKLDINFDEGQTLFRTYDEKNKQWNSMITTLLLPYDKFIKLDLDPKIEIQFKSVPKKDYSLEFEFLNYLPIISKDLVRGNRQMYTKVKSIAEHNSGFIFDTKLINDNNYKNEFEYYDECINYLANFIISNGRPKSIFVRDEETKYLLQDFCSKAKIKLIVSSKLKALDFLYEEMLKNFGL